jgi:hypothetical protein
MENITLLIYKPLVIRFLGKGTGMIPGPSWILLIRTHCQHKCCCEWVCHGAAG